jgi:ABC-type Na+ efflux pump permease subunit
MSLGTNRDLVSEPMSIVGIVAARIVGGAVVATAAVGVVFVAIMLVESLNRSPAEIAKEPRPVG